MKYFTTLISFCGLVLLLGLSGCDKKSQSTSPSSSADIVIANDTKRVVLGYNDLGMHCMNQDFSEFMILPPFNTLHAQVIDYSSIPSKIVTTGIVINYEIPGNTISSTKTNFWKYAQQLLGVSPAADIGLTGHGLKGSMAPTGNGDWSATGIPLTPMTDINIENPFQLANIVVTNSGGDTMLTRTEAVVPVSWELRCDLCHHGAPDAPKSVLQAHDLLHGTALYDSTTGGPVNGKPILCGGCHAQPELGLAGQPGVKNLSAAMHNAHTMRMMDVAASVPNGVVCYACHPGPDKPCLRDVHAGAQMTCYSCHGTGAKDGEATMMAVADPSRKPWVSEPACGDCHHIAGHDYEQPGTLFRNSKGHGGVFCEACHGSTHAITPSTNSADNVQALALQSAASPIKKCTVCHLVQPTGEFVHRFVTN